MKYYKQLEDGKITMIGEDFMLNESQISITKEEYEELRHLINNSPEDTLESVYYLSETGVYEARERTAGEKVRWYVTAVRTGTIDMNAVPAEYYDEVCSIVNTPKAEPTYTLDEAAAIIASEVAGNE